MFATSHPFPEGEGGKQYVNRDETIKFMLCFSEVFQQIITGIKLTLKMQRTKNEFDAERRILRASGTRDMANLVSYPPYGERKLNTVGLKSFDLFYDLCKAEGTHGIISSSSKH